MSIKHKVHRYIYIYIYVYIYIHIDIYIYIHMCRCMHIFVHTSELFARALEVTRKIYTPAYDSFNRDLGLVLRLLLFLGGGGGGGGVE